MKGKKYKESESHFSFEFGGENYIDANALSISINNVIESLQNITSKQDPESYVKLKVTKFRDGSFDIDFMAIAGVASSLFIADGITFANNVVSIFINSINIKKFLKGKKPHNIEEKENNTIITNVNNEKLTVDSQTAQTYFADSKIDTNIVNIFNVTIAEKSKKLTIKHDSKTMVEVEDYEFTDMTKNIVEDPEPIDIITNTVLVSLLLKKPDLLGNSKWGFILDKNIEASIKDENWLKMVHKGKIKNLFAGVKIPVKLLIELPIDQDRNPMEAQYTILEVTGDIIEPNNDEQQTIF